MYIMNTLMNSMNIAPDVLFFASRFVFSPSKRAYNRVNLRSTSTPPPQAVTLATDVSEALSSTRSSNEKM